MVTIPVKVKNVSVYPYIDVIGHGPVVEPVLTNGTGLYVFGTFMTCSGYSLDLGSADQQSPLYVHDKYYATYEDEQGRTATTGAMFCTEKGPAPKFSMSKCLPMPIHQGDDMVEHLSVPPFNVLTPLTDVTVSQLFPAPAIGQISLITGATGNIIATQFGTPHLMGVEVKGGMRSDQLRLGMGRIIITGKLPSGKLYTATHETCVSIGDPAVFFRTFPG
jgi:hypothetical protein